MTIFNIVFLFTFTKFKHISFKKIYLMIKLFIEVISDEISKRMERL